MFLLHLLLVLQPLPLLQAEVEVEVEGLVEDLLLPLLQVLQPLPLLQAEDEVEEEAVVGDLEVFCADSELALSDHLAPCHIILVSMCRRAKGRDQPCAHGGGGGLGAVGGWRRSRNQAPNNKNAT